MFKLEYNGLLYEKVDEVDYAKVLAADPRDGLAAATQPWADELDAEGKPSGVIASGYWRIVPTA